MFYNFVTVFVPVHMLLPAFETVMSQMDLAIITEKLGHCGRKA